MCDQSVQPSVILILLWFEANISLLPLYEHITEHVVETSLKNLKLLALGFLCNVQLYLCPHKDEIIEIYIKSRFHPYLRIQERKKVCQEL